jgi:hypothetical protein
MLIENTPAPKLRMLYYRSGQEADEVEEIISVIASNYHTLTVVTLIAEFDSSSPLLKIVECCRGTSN